MRILEAFVHLAEQIMYGDKLLVSSHEKERALTELLPLEEAYKTYWAGGPRPDQAHVPEGLFYKTILDAFTAVSKTQAHLDEEVLSFRLDGWLIDGHSYQKRPWAIFYFWNECYFGFHIRFQDIARGGLRTVVSRTLEQEAQDRKQIFCECYDLAFTQEWKNKDIPEGGAKGVIFVPAIYARDIDAIQIFQKKCIEAFLELLVTDVSESYFPKKIKKNIFNLDKKPEWIFLGPDERMSDSILAWIGDYSKEIGYGLGAAIMSSRPKVGINHKQYAVTSHGLMVYIEEALLTLGINPYKDPFCIKISGGPDGDVAGNTIKLLAERFENTAKIVAIKDVSGVLYDPHGIPFSALLPLVESSSPIAHINFEELHEDSFLLDMNQEIGEEPYFLRHSGERLAQKVRKERFNIEAAKTLFDGFLHRVHADLFLPAGGRRSSLHMENISDFMPDGVASSKLIVEGANVYLTQPARDVLESSGVLIMKDSSANKGGVISSSYEIQALLTIGEDGLILHKEAIVREILEKIHILCQYESRCILHQVARTKRPASVISQEISVLIRSLSSDILVWLEGWDSVLFWKCIEVHFLPNLVKHAFDRIRQLPTSYLFATVSSFIASRLVYRYGVAGDGLGSGLVLPYPIDRAYLDRMAQDALDFALQRENQHS